MIPFTVVAPTASADGYGCSAEHLVLAAVRHHQADIAFIEWDWRDARFTDPQLFELMSRGEAALRERPVSVVYFLPYALARFRSSVSLNMTMWETDRLPDRWAQIIDRLAHGVIVPSEHCRQVFAERVSCPVRAVPFGTDTDLFTFVERDPDREPFLFLMSGLLHYRKGVEFALRAFREEFTASEPVELILKTRRRFLDAGPEEDMLGDPRVKVITTDFTREEMRDLYHGVDCLLAPSRGEGSGLTPRDAMSTGLPVILTDWSGLAEIADERYAYPVEVECLEVAPDDNSSYGPGITGGGPIGNFARPSLESLRAQMRAVFEDRVGALHRGGRASHWMRNRWTWAKCAGVWLAAIEELSGCRASASS